jgi:hypothetical protein
MATHDVGTSLFSAEGLRGLQLTVHVDEQHTLRRGTSTGASCRFTRILCCCHNGGMCFSKNKYRDWVAWRVLYTRMHT